MSEDAIPADAVEEIDQILTEDSNGNPGDLSLETLVLLVNTSRLSFLRDKINTEFAELKQRQEKVSFLHKLLKKINVATSDKGEFDSSEEIQKLLAQAKEMGVEMLDKQHYTKEERDRLVENIQMTIEDFNVSNDMQLQAVNRLTNERYESYQLARSILKPLHEAKMQTARGVK